MLDVAKRRSKVRWKICEEWWEGMGYSVDTGVMGGLTCMSLRVKRLELEGALALRSWLFSNADLFRCRPARLTCSPNCLLRAPAEHAHLTCSSSLLVQPAGLTIHPTCSPKLLTKPARQNHHQNPRKTRRPINAKPVANPPNTPQADNSVDTQKIRRALAQRRVR